MDDKFEKMMENAQEMILAMHKMFCVECQYCDIFDGTQGIDGEGYCDFDGTMHDIDGFCEKFERNRF